VAHSDEADVVDTIYRILNEPHESGAAFGAVKKQFLDLMQAEDWYGKKGDKDKEYINRRIGVICGTNMRTAYEAEHYRKRLEGAALRPIRVCHSLMFGDNRREEHKALNGKAFRYDDPFRDTCYPPNGWGMRMLCHQMWCRYVRKFARACEIVSETRQRASRDCPTA